METRLNKFIANAGICSRRDADELIMQGRVKINGVLATQGMKVLENDTVTVDDKIVGDELIKKIYLVLHKPIQVLSTVSDPEGRTTVLDILPKKYHNFRLYPVGRLDFFSEGLVFLTNDGELTHTLMHPRHNLARVYRVRVRKNNPKNIDTLLQYMEDGMTLADGTELAPIRTEIFSERNTTPVEYDLELTLFQGINRQIRRMCEDLDLTVLRLMRISHGPLHLGDLQKGECRELTPNELNRMKMLENKK